MIACLGWGSLIWAPGKLPIQQPWSEDGPKVKVEFARRSRCRIYSHNSDCELGPITLVLYNKAAEKTSLWARMTPPPHDFLGQ